VGPENYAPIDNHPEGNKPLQVSSANSLLRSGSIADFLSITEYTTVIEEGKENKKSAKGPALYENQGQDSCYYSKSISPM
jgi:hypothetical protein